MNTLSNLRSATSATIGLLFAAGFIAWVCLTQAQSNVPAVVINEVLANNQSVTNGDGGVTDWVELCNLTAQPLDLGDCSLTDDPANPRRWTFPTGTIVPPSSFVVVRCDGGSPPSTGSGEGFNTGFSINSRGGQIHLFDKLGNGGAVLDSLVFGLQIPDFSVGRVPDGTGGWRLCRPTPGAANVAASLGDPAALKLNEWMSHPQNDDSDWFELYNPLPEPVALGGSYLTDNLDNPTQYCIPPYSYLGTGGSGFVVFYADHNTAAGADHTGFRLGNGGGEIGLCSAAGNAIDTAAYGAQPEGVSEGRLPDGGTTIVQFPGSATPGASNHSLGPEPPTITQQPLSQTNSVGRTVMFTVTATGTPPLTYQWQKESINLSGQTGVSLTLPNVQLADAGLYRVVVSNAAGAVTSAEATLAVYPSQDGPGSLDFSFVPGINARADVTAVAQQVDGKLLVGGYRLHGESYSLIRLNSDGTEDSSFNVGPAHSVQNSIAAMAIDLSGHILVAARGWLTNHQGYLRDAVIRLNPDGSQDTTFQFYGLSVPGFAGSIDSLVLLSDGKILIGGDFFDGVGGPQGFACLNPLLR